MIHRFLCILFLIAFLDSSCTKQLKKSDPTHVEFAWDIHKTLLKKYYPLIPSATILPLDSIIRPCEEFHSFDFNTFLRLKNMSPLENIIQRKLYKLNTLIEKTPHLQKSFNTLFNCFFIKNPAVSGYHYPTHGIAALLEEINQLGYTQRVAANISPHEYTRLQQKFPHFFRFFKDNNPVLFDGLHAPLKKPDINYFITFQKRYNPTGQKIEIFIDEKEANVKSAIKAGMIGIRFKNATQLRQDLKKLGIPLH